MKELKSCPNCGRTQLNWWRYDDIYRIECDGCGMSGPEGKDLKTAKAAWNALPRRLRWTKEKPTDGWYWLRRPGETSEVVNVDRGRYVSGKSYGAPLSNEEFDDAEWAGPIQEPMEENK